MFHEGYVRYELEARKREVENQSRTAWKFFEQPVVMKKNKKSRFEQKDPCCVCICQGWRELR